MSATTRRAMREAAGGDSNDAQERLAAIIDQQKRELLAGHEDHGPWPLDAPTVDDTTFAATGVAEEDFNRDITEGIEATVDEALTAEGVGGNVTVIPGTTYAQAVEVSRVEEARGFFTDKLNALMERKTETERRIALIHEARAERELEAKGAFNREMAAASLDFEVALLAENEKLAETTTLKEAFDLALGRLNKG